jgi:tetratricopeptide (TPR) repeat protein
MCSFLVHRFDVLRASNDFEQAERLCHRAWTVDSTSMEVQMALGDLYRASGQMETARESYAAALAINPNSLKAQVGLAGTFYDENPDLAEIQLKRIIQQHPGSPNAYSNLAYFYRYHDKYTDAIEPARWYVRLRPSSESGKYNLAGILVLAGRFSEAKSLLLAMLEDQSTTFAGGAASNLATILFFEGDYAAAAELYRDAIESSPENSLAHRNLGDAIWHLDGKDAAEPIFRSAIHFAEQQLEINPTDIYVLQDLMLAYASVGDLDRFRSTRNTLLELGAASAETHYSIAVSASRLVDMKTARLHAKKAYELAYPSALLRADPDISASGVSID